MAYKCFNLAARNNYNGQDSNFKDSKVGRYLLGNTPRLIMVKVN